MVELFGLDLEKKVKHLSKGTLVKLSLLLAVSHEPELLLLDEPLSGLDPIAREEFLDGVLRTICDRRQTVLISSHMLDDVRRLADTVGILTRGDFCCKAISMPCSPRPAHLGDAPRRKSAHGHHRRRHLAARRGARMDDHGPRFHADEVPADSSDRRRGARQRDRPRAGRTFQGLHSRTKGIAMSMKWLLWKDYRQNRPVVVMILFFLVIPHLVALCGACWMTFRESSERSPWTVCFGTSSLLSLFVSQLLVAVIGGNAFAGERADRSAEFLVSLPVTRGRIVASKVLFAVTIIATVWLVNAPGLMPVAIQR